MENPGSSIIASFGAGSGINFSQLAGDLSEASFGFRREQLETRNETLEARISAASLLRNALTNLSTSLGDRIRNGDLAPTVEIGNSAVANVTTQAGSNPEGSYSLEVSQLAQEQLLTSKALSSSADLVGEGTLRVRFGTVAGANFTEDTGQTPLEIAVEATDTLQTLADKISSASGGALDAYVANGTNGAQLVIKGEEGAANGFILEGESSALLPSATPGDLSYFSWSPSTDSGELRQSSQDALFALDTVPMSSASNTVTGLPESITLDLKATNVGAPTSIGFSNNTSAITSVMGDFVAALNELSSQLSDSANVLGGELGSDAGARELKRDLARLSTEIVMPTAADGEPRTLGDLGLALNRDGSFRLDTDRLNDTLAASPEAAAAMFTNGPFGLFATVDNLARDNTTVGDPGSLGGSVNRYESQIERNEERLERIAEQQERLRERLASSLLAAEQRVTASQSTLSFLQAQADLNNAR
ncbi:MAG: flagellar filament capping protein FliD [Pseudomonadota bacterium]